MKGNHSILVGLYLALILFLESKENAACIPEEWTSSGDLFWTSGQRIDENNCKSPFVWKPSSDTQQPIYFTNWFPNEPSCLRTVEGCLFISAKRNFSWGDLGCTWKICS